ncbi:alpha/beta fold hydrolase [Streptomonospora litoralis]|uniref:Sigma factor SigB regulation protein RsbQ n=1 Tax=Streptomonospora litoralis TaxID=2498135 RepID=A0A4P6Q7H7_9ACTN|nr:alpha/beta hydrolase [Streptomonospora litoralis]QBI54914.1 Sigma factor SigB regulation protein RsbQ [Streptomonospora litoralis]
MSDTTTEPAAAATAAGEGTVVADDGARLAVTVLEPVPAHSPFSSAAAGLPTAVLAHGWGAGRRVWGTVADRLIRGGHRVVLYDQRGHGGSGTGTEPIAVDRLGRDLAAVLEAVGAERAVVVGHSGGGFAALAHTSGGSESAKRRVGGLVLVSTAAHDQDTPEGEVRMMGSPLFSRALARPALGRRLLAQTMGKGADPRLLEVHRQMFAATPAQVRASCFRCSRGMDLREPLASVAVPAVVLAGAQDRTIAPRLGAAVAEALPEARFAESAGIGHMLPLEAPSAVVEAVSEVAAAVDGGRLRAYR